MLLVPSSQCHRVVDKYNAKIFRVRFEKQEDVVRLQDRKSSSRSIPGGDANDLRMTLSCTTCYLHLFATMIYYCGICVPGREPNMHMRIYILIMSRLNKLFHLLYMSWNSMEHMSWPTLMNVACREFNRRYMCTAQLWMQLCMWKLWSQPYAGLHLKFRSDTASSWGRINK